MTSRRPFGGDETARERAIQELFPNASKEAKLAMVSRTPGHMIMPLVRMRLISRMLAYAKEVHSKIGEDDEGDEIADGFISQETFDNMKAGEYLELVTSDINLVDVFIEEYDTRMIGREGAGRDDMKEIFGDLQKKGDEGVNRVALD